jgi:hypothetical protein
MEHNWAIVLPAKYVLAKDITSTQKLLLGIVSGLSNMNGYCYASNDYLSKCLDVTKTRISQCISDLAKKNYIKISIKYRDGSKEIEQRVIILNIDLYKNIDIPIKDNDSKVYTNSFTPIIKNDKDNIYTNNIYNKVKSMPTEQEVIDYFIEKGSTIEQAKKAYEYYSVANWKDSRGKQVKNWKQKMLSVWINNNNFKQQKQNDYETRINHATELINWAKQQDRADGIN